MRLNVPDLPIKSAARAAEDEFMLMELEKAVAEWTASLGQVMDEERTRAPQGPGIFWHFTTRLMLYLIVVVILDFSPGYPIGLTSIVRYNLHIYPCMCICMCMCDYMCIAG